MNLVFGCRVAMAVFHVLCYVMRRISNLVVRAMGWEPRPRMEGNHVPRAATTRNARLTGKKNKPEKTTHRTRRTPRLNLRYVSFLASMFSFTNKIHV